MTAAEVAERVLAAVDRGDLSPGGPSELAARRLLDRVPAGYWDQWTEDTVGRIRAGAREAA